jgi:hypothetical protein
VHGGSCADSRIGRHAGVGFCEAEAAAEAVHGGLCADSRIGRHAGVGFCEAEAAAEAGHGGSCADSLAGKGCWAECTTGEQLRAVTKLQEAWRWRQGSTLRLTSIEDGWTKARARQLGDLVAHVSFLQYVFRSSRKLRPGCWRRSGLRGVMTVLRLAWQRVPRCDNGANLAHESEFGAQQARAERVLELIFAQMCMQVPRRAQT